MKQVRVEAKVKNNVLWRFIYDNYENLAEYCRKHNYSTGIYNTINNLINLNIEPWGRHTRRYSRMAEELAKDFNVIPEILFPRELYGVRQTTAVVEVSLAAIQGREEVRLLPESTLYKKEIKEAIQEVLKTIPPREAEVVYRRAEGATLEEIASESGVTKERIRQIEAKGLRRLRHPKRSEKLEAAYKMMQDI